MNVFLLLATELSILFIFTFNVLYRAKKSSGTRALKYMKMVYHTWTY
ncbi:hypothetical protein FORC13_p055 (plasmid) [Bacillus cereus]|nr:hypothetical protein FORC13_p055 [Bacillus cereus]